MNINKNSQKLSFITTRILSKDKSGMEYVGTGFFYSIPISGMQPCYMIVTNKHVACNMESLSFTLSKSNRFITSEHDSAIPYFEEPYVVQMTKDKLDKFVFPHPDNEVDLCAIFIQKELHELYNAPKPYYMCALSKSDLMTKDAAKSLPGICDIIMVGYPNGLWDSKHNMPIYRKGITATWPCLDYNGKRQFVIDCACFGGSSGSPVFYTNTHTLQGYENPKLIGVLYAGPVVNSVGEIVVETGSRVLPNAHTQTRNMMNLGFVVFADCVSELEGIVRNSLKL